MSKLLLSCDNSIYSYGGRYYFKDEEWRDFYYRYLRVFENLRIANRVIIEESLSPRRVKIEDERIDVVNLPSFSGPKEYASVYFKIGKKMKHITEGCDAAIVRLPSTIGQRVCNQVVRAKLPYAVEVVYDAEDGWRSATSIIEKYLWKRIDHKMRLSCYNADGISCVTESYLQKHYFSKKNNAFYSHYSTLSLDISFFTNKRKFPNKRMLIANVANQIALDGRKGFKEIITAIGRLKSRGLRVDAHFVGSSYHNGAELLLSYAESLGVKEQIHFEGYLSREELSRFLEKVDLFVMPTRAEGLPRVIIEAMAKGLPCITTPVSGNPELVSSYFLIPYEDVNSLADRIYELCTNSSLYEKTSEENYTKSLQYEASILQKRRDKFYSKLKSVTV